MKSMTVAKSSKAPIVKKAAKSAYKKLGAVIAPTDSGYSQRDSGVLVPEFKDKKAAVTPSGLQRGISAAQDQIKKTIRSIADIFSEELEVSEIDLTLGFDAKGNFIGFGVGTSFSIKVKVKPRK